MKKRLLSLLLCLTMLVSILPAGIFTISASAAEADDAATGAVISTVALTIPEPKAGDMMAYQASAPEDEETCTFADEVTVTVNGNPAAFIARDHLVWYTLTLPDGIPVRYHYMFPLPGDTDNHIQEGYTDEEGYVQYPDGMPDRDDEGFTFIDWYTDETFATRFNFSDPVTDEVDLYARWVPDEDVCDLFVYLDPQASEPTYGADVPRGDVYGEPAAPGRDGEVFCGWYTDRELTKKYDPDEPIMENTSLFPRWVKDEDMCTVYIYLDVTDEDYIAGAKVPRGDVYGEPAAPGRDGEVFCGWYTDRELTKKYEPYEPIMEDTSLFPRWVKDEDICAVYIYLSATDEGPTSGVEIPRGDVYGKPGEPGRVGEVFCGWYTDRELTKPYNPTAPIMEDTYLFARWMKQEEYDSIILGDADGDGEVTIVDATIIQRELAGIKTDNFNRLAADSDRDDEVTIFDATYIQLWLVGRPTNEYIGRPMGGNA